ncbi:MAG TPA: cation:proton antiporter [Flavitalea sp.]|nr:cation:proton antiporter [Flavitalea sp.]
MYTHLLIITIIGLAALGMAWMPAITEKTSISYSIIYVFLGMILYAVFSGLPPADPIRNNLYTIRISELVVIISLMGTGLKIDQRFSLKEWKIPFRLVIITMILCIAAVTFCCWYFLGFNLPSSLLIGAVLAPTDPVLASDVQVGPPLEKQKNNIRFSLTAEAGLNDGMAFPFTWLAIRLALLAGTSTTFSGVLFEWLVVDVFYKIVMGVIAGYLMGRLLAYLVFHLPEKRHFLVTKDGFVALSATLLVYGMTELISGYGFIAVFITAVTLRNYEIGHKYHVKLHAFTDQVERMLLAIILILFGGSLTTGLLDELTLQLAGIGLLFILIIRPAAGMLTLIGSGLHIKEKLAISFFGIRGMGSVFYLAFALHAAKFAPEKQLWSLLGFIILLSVVIHGLTATVVMKSLEPRFSKKVRTL